MIDATTIERRFRAAGSDKHIHGYHEYYQQIMDENVNSILEIGIKAGASLFAWKQLLPRAKIAGMDINPEELTEAGYVSLTRRGIDCVFGDSTNKEHTERVKGNFDIIIDDGSHFYVDIMATFENFKDRFNKYYIIEDSMYDHEGVVEFIKSKGFSNVEVYDSKWKVDVSVSEEFLKYGTLSTNKKFTKKTLRTTLKWIKVTK